MNKTEFTKADLDDLGSLIGSDGLRAIKKLMDLEVEDCARQVLTCDVNNNSFAAIGIKKSIYEGANKLRQRLLLELNRLAALDAGSKR